MSGRQAEGWLGWEATWGTGQSPPGWGPPGGHPGSLLGAGGPVSSVCITVNSNLPAPGKPGSGKWRNSDNI